MQDGLRKKKIRFYNSFEEQREDEARMAASEDGVERIARVVKMIKRIYPKMDGKEECPKSITFVKTFQPKITDAP